MNQLKKILIAEDEKNTAKYFGKILTQAGFEVDITFDGKEAFEKIQSCNYNVLITDWMMPKIDGINLIKKVRSEIKPVPLILMITTLGSDMSKNLALTAGADDYLMKPINPGDLISILNNTFKRNAQDINLDISKFQVEQSAVLPPYIAVVIAISTGGPITILEVFKKIKFTDKAAFFIVQHGPEWMFDSYAKRIQENSQFKTLVCTDDMPTEPGKVYIAPGDYHILIENDSYNIKLSKSPKENFVRPSADPLFLSAAKAFGRYCIAVVMTGLGADGARGCVAVQSALGKVIVQDPLTAIAPSMPSSVIKTNIQQSVVHLENLHEAISSNIYTLSSSLAKNRLNESH